ncbi:MAG: hypothetical protein RSD96_01685 [Bacilli bacterium]
MNDYKEFLLFLDNNIFMGKSTIKEVLLSIKNKQNKIKTLIESELEYFESLSKKLEKILKKEKINTQNNILTNKMVSTNIKISIMKDNSDSKIADMLIKGYTMGILDLTRKTNNYKDEVNHSIYKVANDLLSFEKRCIKELNEFI